MAQPHQREQNFKNYARLPLVLQRLILTFCDVKSICCSLQRTNRNVGAVARALIALPQSQDNLPHAFQDPTLTARYEHICQLRAHYLELKGARHKATGVTALQVQEWYTAPWDKFKKLILPEELGGFLLLDPLEAIDQKEYNFKTFVDVIDNILTTVKVRRDYLLEHFTPADAESPPEQPHGVLTARGKHVCETYFKLFDRDHDGALNFKEMEALNQAAGSIFSDAIFEWMQTEFSCNNDGAVTKQGCEELFLHNCWHVPDMTYKDLISIHQA